jgi:hypothetical protein
MLFSLLPFSQIRSFFITQSAPFTVSYKTAVSDNNYRTSAMLIRGCIRRNSLKLTADVLFLKLKQRAGKIEISSERRKKRYY